MLGQASLQDDKTSIILQLEVDEHTLSQEVAARGFLRFLWTGLGSAVLVLIGVSACVFHPFASDASAERSSLVADVAFNPVSELGLRGVRPARTASGPAITAFLDHDLPKTAKIDSFIDADLPKKTKVNYADLFVENHPDIDPVDLPTNDIVDPAIENVIAEPVMGQLILLRHGQSEWNKENRFTGWANVDLSSKGEREAADAAKLLLMDGDQIDLIYTSTLGRSIRTAEICIDALEAAGRSRPPIRSRWRLNERHYGALQGLNKLEARQMFQKADLQKWRTSFEGRPPAMQPDHPHFSRTQERCTRLVAGKRDDTGWDLSDPAGYGHSIAEPLEMENIPLTESLADTHARVKVLWHEELWPQLRRGKNVLLVGHANCMRALIACIQTDISNRNLPSLGVPNALPIVYTFDREGQPIQTLKDLCYVEPIKAAYLGEECVLFNELDADGDGALDETELDNSEFCKLAYESDFAADSCGAMVLSEADGNQDGFVDFNEYMNWWGKLPEKYKTREMAHA